MLKFLYEIVINSQNNIADILATQNVLNVYLKTVSNRIYTYQVVTDFDISDYLMNCVDNSSVISFTYKRPDIWYKGFLLPYWTVISKEPLKINYNSHILSVFYRYTADTSHYIAELENYSDKEHYSIIRIFYANIYYKGNKSQPMNGFILISYYDGDDFMIIKWKKTRFKVQLDLIPSLNGRKAVLLDESPKEHKRIMKLFK